jgi:hypothetical protein
MTKILLDKEVDYFWLLGGLFTYYHETIQNTKLMIAFKPTITMRNLLHAIPTTDKCKTTGICMNLTCLDCVTECSFYSRYKKRIRTKIKLNDGGKRRSPSG